MDFQVGLLDIDICGPSIPKMLGLEGQDIHQSNLGWSPVYVESNLGVMSIGFMLPNPDDAVIWRGPRKNGLIKQFLKDVYWGELDFLVVDAPPGTSDEHISIVQCLQVGEDINYVFSLFFIFPLEKIERKERLPNFFHGKCAQYMDEDVDMNIAIR